jgi:hypothetical protein
MKVRISSSFAVLALCWAGSATALDRTNLRFHLPFDNDIQPRSAGAKTELVFVKGTEQDAQLVEGRRGRGLRVTPGLNLLYRTRESFAPREGTIAVWVKPVGWSGVNHFRFLLAAHADQSTLLLYIYYGNPWLYVSGPKGHELIGSPTWQFAFQGEPFPEGQWTFLAGTYKPGQQAFYINGKLIVRRTDGLIEPEFIEKGIVEIPSGDQVLDEVMIFDRVLTEQEIGAVYRANVPAP